MNYVEYRQQIAADLAARTAAYQQSVAAPAVDAAMAGPRPLHLLADGDSWFDYPLGGAVPLVTCTDVIAQLPGLCAPAPKILNLAHHGDATTTEVGLARTQKLINAIQDPANGGFDAILFSGGGDDVAGDPFNIWLNDAASVGGNPAFGLNQTRFNGVLSVIEASYLDLIELRDENLPGAPIFCHAYDIALPTGVGVCTEGPWLKPALDYCGWAGNPAGEAQIVKQALTQLAALLQRLAADPANNLIFVPTQGTLAPDQWANELHPTPEGFRLIAARFQAALAARFPGRC